MRVLKKVLLFPIFMILISARLVMKVVIEAECWVAGISFLLLAILAVIGLFNKMWSQLGVIGILFCGITSILFLSSLVQVMIEIAMDSLR